MNILVTGSKGFLGRNLWLALRHRKDVKLFGCDLGTDENILEQGLREANLVFHLAGVNRPIRDEEFHTGNTESTANICSKLWEMGRAPKIVLSSSIQAVLENPYGLSKRNAEEVLRRFAQESGTTCVAYRFKNLFGKWCCPNYNSVTATFCYNIAHDLPIQISDPQKEIDLTYIDDVVSALLSELNDDHMPGFRFGKELKSYRITLGDLAQLVRSFRDMRTSLLLPDFSKPFVRALYATYLSYLDGPDFGYSLEIKSDERGSLAEFIKSEGFGQIFISRTRPGITRGNHYHDTKTEKFVVVEGKAVIRFRHIEHEDVIEHVVRGEEYSVLDIPPGYTHSIENVGKGELVTLFWASEIFDLHNPDTFFAKVRE